MKNSKSRRSFLKTLAVVPALPATGFLWTLSEKEEKTGTQQFSHKFKLSLNVYSFNNPLREGKVDLFDVLDFCAKYNFDAIDPTGYYFPGYPEPPSVDYINDFKRKAFLLGLDISGTGVRNDFANPDSAARMADIRMIKKWIEAAAKLGIPNLRVFAGTNPHEGFSRDQVFEWMAKDVRECCDYGKKFGVIIALQNHNDFLKTAADVDRIFEMVNSEWLGLNLDIGSYRQHDPYEEIEKNIKYAVTWQIKENVWIDGKETPTDFVKLFKIIKKAGYRGYLPIETLGAGDPLEKVPRLLQNVKNALQKIS
ncbi:MAG: TIM barrel protein [Mariniphaga sp.]|jgi:sugar phosphate isomerase/epimerase|nr:TIM barrel protein [Mariniphaga sp.]